MPRPRKTDSSALLRPLIEQFALQIARAVEAQTVGRTQDAIRSALTPASAVAARRKHRSATLCYYPGCKNVAAPRFGMYCAAEHKNLSASAKAKYRDVRAARSAKVARKSARN